MFWLQKIETFTFDIIVFDIIEKQIDPDYLQAEDENNQLEQYNHEVNIIHVAVLRKQAYIWYDMMWFKLALVKMRILDEEGEYSSRLVLEVYRIVEQSLSKITHAVFFFAD